MSMTVEIPFKYQGNRAYLTASQLMQFPWLSDFVKRFENCFEYDQLRAVVWFNPPNHN